MTNKDKQLILQDLCARLPYGVLVKCSDNEGILRYDGYRLHEISEDGSYLALSAVDIPHGVSNLDLEFYDIKPYLRDLSSMTEEETEEYDATFYHEDYGGLPSPWSATYETFDWLNAHHFDFRGLIRMKLAIEAPKDMYKIE